jgi:hypothetical protein
VLAVPHVLHTDLFLLLVNVVVSVEVAGIQCVI